MQVNKIITESKTYTREQHKITPEFVSKGAITVLNNLKAAGYDAYLVGGGVRDLLLGKQPKDFDIATDALPDEIKSLFGFKCRIIGRRFRLAHVRIGREIVEIATFRGESSDSEDDDAKVNDAAAEYNKKPLDKKRNGQGNSKGNSKAHSANIPDQHAPHVKVNGRILRDNVYSTDVGEDAVRRDFTVNCLYYDPQEGTVLDFTDGMQDLQSGVMRMIGDANERYKEDPVRILRALRFAAKLDFKLAHECDWAIDDCAHLLSDVAPARLFDEMLKLFLTGHAASSFNILKKYRVLEYIFPETAVLFNDNKEGYEIEQFILRALRDTDTRVREEKPVTPAFLLAAMLWEPLKRDAKAYISQGLDETNALEHAGTDILERQAEYVAIPRRFSFIAKEIWNMQPQLTKNVAKNAANLVNRRRFRAGYDFLVLRAAAGEPVKDIATWWTKFQDVDEVTRYKMISSLQSKKTPQSSRKKKTKKKRSFQAKQDKAGYLKSGRKKKRSRHSTHSNPRKFDVDA